MSRKAWVRCQDEQTEYRLQSDLDIDRSVLQGCLRFWPRVKHPS